MCVKERERETKYNEKRVHTPDYRDLVGYRKAGEREEREESERERKKVKRVSERK